MEHNALTPPPGPQRCQEIDVSCQKSTTSREAAAPVASSLPPLPHTLEAFFVLGEISAQGIAVYDDRFLLRYINPALATILGYAKPADLAGTDIRHLVTPGEQQRFVHDLMASHQEHSRQKRAIYAGACQDGSVVWLECCASLIPWENAQAGLVTFLDMTGHLHRKEEVRRLHREWEQRMAERTLQLDSANKELEAFAYSVSHDLRAPLRATDEFSRIVLHDFAAHLPAEGARYLQLIHDNVQRMRQMVNDLLVFSQLHLQPLRRSEVNVEALARQVIAEARAEALRESPRNIEIVFGELPPCLADQTLLRQVFVNLLANALKFTRNRTVTRIEMGSAVLHKQQVYYVRDNGVGFSMAYAHRLFGIFQRLHSTRDYEGTGVGLAIVQRIVHRHGGRVWAEAEVDQGATFFFTLSSFHERAQAVDILLVEDNPLDEAMTLHALQRYDAKSRIEIVRDGAEALQFLFCMGMYAHRHFEEHPRLILLDLMLPKVDGLEILQRLKADIRTQDIPVLVLTSSQQEGDVAESYTLGAHGYLVKPVDFQKLSEAMQRVGYHERRR